MRLLLTLAFACVTALAMPLDAQRHGRLELSLPPGDARGTEGPVLRTPNVLDARQVRDLLRNGFPARLHYRVELWSVGGLVNDLEAATEWDVIVRFNPMDRRYEVARLIGDRAYLLGKFEQFDDAQATVARPFRAPISASRKGRRYYYSANLDLEMLSLSDLDEVERWLKGELRPAVRGRRNPGTAVGRGLRTLFARLLGGERSQYETRSATFRG